MKNGGDTKIQVSPHKCMYQPLQKIKYFVFCYSSERRKAPVLLLHTRLPLMVGKSQFRR